MNKFEQAKENAKALILAFCNTLQEIYGDTLTDEALIAASQAAYTLSDVLKREIQQRWTVDEYKRVLEIGAD